jgi:hypothetical protein
MIEGQNTLSQDNEMTAVLIERAICKHVITMIFLKILTNHFVMNSFHF